MAKQYNPWTGFLEDTAAKANDAAPVVGKKYTINGKEFKVLEVKGDNVKVLGSNGIVSHLSIKMFDEKTTIDKAIHNCDEEQYYKFMLRGGAEYYGTESDMREFFSHLTSKEKKELGTNYKSKTPMSKEEVERWRRNAMNKLGL